jgi:diguanylate cyclase (GGDEF)-like protein/hemerythrin-like metal-binding protein
LHTAEQVNAQLREVVESLEQLASTDLLTNAWNRRRFEEAVEGEIHRFHRYGHPVSLMLLDIDHFKKVNDNYGHQEGDRVLKQVADSIFATIRKSDSLTRWGGEEFIVLMPNTGLSFASTLAERIRAHIAAQSFPPVGGVTVSIGVAEYQPSASYEDWLDRTDRAMYTAKRDGRNRVEVDATASSAPAVVEHFEGHFVQLIWKNAFLSGNDLIDSQHQGLFRVANELLDAVLSGRPTDEISMVVTRLLADVVQHFKDEEGILAELSYPGLADHAGEHARLVAKALELAEAFKGGTLSVGSLFQFLAYDVVTRHMLGADREFFPYTSARAQQDRRGC